MILETLGRLADGQVMTTGLDAVSDNVIDIGASGISDPNNMGNVWLVITTDVAAGGATGLITFDLRVGPNEDMVTNDISIMSVVIPGTSDYRVAAAGRYICRCTLPYELWSVANNGGATFTYMGLYVTQAAASTITYSAAVSPSQPPTDFNTQVIRSNVGTPT
jgi:hypothetical protein